MFVKHEEKEYWAGNAYSAQDGTGAEYLKDGYSIRKSHSAHPGRALVFNGQVIFQIVWSKYGDDWVYGKSAFKQQVKNYFAA